MTEKQQPNPFREGLSTKAVPQPCAVVIFGATGDLTHRKLVPALYNIAADGELPPAVAVVGFARRPKSDDEFRQEMEEASLATKPVTRNSRSASTGSTRRAGRAAIAFSTSLLRRISSKRSCKI